MKPLYRKVLLLIVVVSVIFAGAYFISNQRTVSFADPRLEDVIREELEEPEGNLRKGQVKRITDLDARGFDIRHLDGIENLVNLTHLNLEDNFIEDVSPLQGLENLTFLSLRNNEIICLETINFDAITDLSLKYLSLRHNVRRFPEAPQRRLADITLLSHFDELIFLEIRDNHIENINPLSKLTSLEYLDISQNPLEEGSIDVLQEHRHLQELNLRETRLKSISSVRHLQNLTYLNIHTNPFIDDLSPLGDLEYLEVLIMRNVPMGEQIHFLSQLDRLWRINLRNCGITDLTVLGDLMERGALQDDPAFDIEASVDIRDNPVPTKDEEGVDGYLPIRPYWENISERYPEELPY